MLADAPANAVVVSDRKEAVREILRGSMAALCPDPDLAALFAADSARECRDTELGGA